MTPDVITYSCRGSKQKNRRTRPGLTTPELLVTALILSILMLAAFSLFKTSWQSYDNLVWQTKVNMEARQTLDDICDMLRTSGNNVDMMRPLQMFEGQVSIDSTRNKLVLMTTDLGYQTYLSRRGGDNIWYMTRRFGASVRPEDTRKVGQYIRSIELEYEYRLPASSDADPVWRFVRVNDASANWNAAYLATTVYVTVKAEARPYADGTIYKRTLTGAIRLRGPHGMMLPPAQYFGPNLALPSDNN
jgi:hypothetical protein